MTDRELIEAELSRRGLVAARWEEDPEDGLTAVIRHKWRVVTPEFEDDGLYEGDAGTLSACVVGSEQYRNRRVHWSFTPESYDEGNEVRDLSALEPEPA